MHTDLLSEWIFKVSSMAVSARKIKDIEQALQGTGHAVVEIPNISMQLIVMHPKTVDVAKNMGSLTATSSSRGGEAEHVHKTNSWSTVLPW